MIRKVIYTAALLVGSIGMSLGQSVSMMNFNMNHNANLFNPAIIPDASWEFTLPTSFYFRGGNNELTLGDLFGKDVNLGERLSEKVAAMNGGESIFYNMNIELFNLGIKLKGTYLSAGAYMSSDVNLSGYGGFLKLIFDGNAKYIDNPLDLSDFGMDVLNTLTYHVGFASKVPLVKGLQLGGRLKYISGIQHADLKNNVFSISTDPDTYYLNVKSDLIARTSGIDSNAISNPINSIERYLKGANSGIGIDIGASYQMTEKLNLFGSVTDLGTINWKTAATVYENNNAEFTFEGYEYDVQDSSEFDLNAVIDTLIDALLPNKREEAYKSSLYTKFSVGASYQVTNRLSADAMLFGKIYGGKLLPSLYLSGTYALINGFQLRASYYAQPGYYMNINTGLGLNLGVAQIYVMLENGTALLNLPSASNAGVQFGISFGNFKIFKRKEKPEVL